MTNKLNWMGAAGAVLFLGLLLVSASGCKDKTPEPAGPEEHAAMAGFANATCPMMPNKIDPDKVTPELTRQFQGKKVAFCCGGCPGKWDELSDEEKAAKLAQVTPGG